MREVLGLAPKTCWNHSRELSRLLDAVPIRKASDLEALRPPDLTSYLTGRSAQCQPSSLHQIAGSVRHFLRFAKQEGWITDPLSLAVPKIACRVAKDLPIYLTEQQLELLLGSWDTNTA